MSPPWKRAIPKIALSLSDVRKGDLLPSESKARAIELMSSYAGYALTFTDGSKTADGVGCAFVSDGDTRSFSLPGHSSVFTAELVALAKALCFIEVGTEASHLVLSDSLSSLLALRDFYPSNPLVQNILERLTVMDNAGKSVHFCWIPSHVGISGNELADAAARRASSVPSTRRLPLPARDFYPAVNAFVRNQWQLSWDTQANNKLRELKPTLGHWPSSARKSRCEEVSLCRLRVGHCYATHGYLLRGEDRPTCPSCRAPLTVAHVLLECPRHNSSRVRLLGRLSPPVTLRHLLGDDSHWVRSGSLFSFFRDIKFPIIYSSR